MSNEPRKSEVIINSKFQLMKKITLLSVLFFSFSALAQITYTSDDFATAGEEFTVSTANMSIANFAATGANYNWDFSSLTAASQTTAGWQNPNTSGYKLSWCLSHFYLFTCNAQFNNNFSLAAPMGDDINIGDYTISNIVEHSNVSATSLSNKMRGMTAEISGIPLPLTVDYDDPDEIYNFPMVYNDTYTNTGHFTIDLNNMGMDFTYDLATTRTNTVQGWGSLTTPMGTFPDVLKIKCVTQRTDMVVVGGIEIPIPTTTVSYQWFSKDYGIPVLQADGIELFNFFIPTTVRYLDQQLCLTADAAFGYLPTADYNPETQSASVSFANLSTNYNSVLWDFGDGDTSTENQPAHNYNCPGTHTVTLTVTNSICQPSTTDMFTLPIIVTDTQNALTTNVTVSETTLTADRDVPGTTYQWVDCDNGNAPIVGEIGQAFTPAASGNFACMMSTNGCDGISACTSFTLLGNSHFEAGQFQLYPNPTTGQLHLSNNTLNIRKVEIYNTLGMLVSKNLDISGQASGIYIVKITADEGSFVRKVVKK
jgi:PKD repeat protein